MTHWGLLEAAMGERPDGSKRIGFYKITQRGVDFVRDRVRVPAHAFFYAQECIGMSEEKTSIKRALGKRFSYDELMSG